MHFNIHVVRKVELQIGLQVQEPVNTGIGSPRYRVIQVEAGAGTG